MESLSPVVAYLIKFFINPSFREKQTWMRWLAGKLSILGPNTWTALRAPLILDAFLCFYFGMPWTGLILATLAFLTDAADGMVARHLGIAGGKFGSAFDGAIDKMIHCLLLYLGWKFGIPFFVAMAIMISIEVFNLATTLVSKKRDGDIFEHLMVGKYKFVLQIGLFYILWVANFIFPDWPWWLLWIIILISVINILAFFSAICKINRKLERFLADSITLENVFCGIAVFFLAKSNYKFAAALVVVAGVFDVLDGFIARKMGSSGSKYGDIKDCIGDVITFGLAAAFSFFVDGIHWTICLFFLCCTIMRLYYYIQFHAPEGIFFGFPCPAAAIIPSSFLLWENRISVSDLEIIVLLCAILEVSFVCDTFFGKIEFKWYNAKKFFRMPGKAKIFFVAPAVSFAAFGMIGEAISLLVLSYLFLFFKPVADWVFGWGKIKEIEA